MGPGFCLFLDQRFPNVDVIYDSGFKAVKEQSVTRKYFPEAPEKSRKNPQDIVIQAPDVVLDSRSKVPDQTEIFYFFSYLPMKAFVVGAH